MFKYRLTETMPFKPAGEPAFGSGYKITEIATDTVIKEFDTPLPIAEQDLPLMYKGIEELGIDHFDVEDGYTGNSI